jgi:glycosylphosphatidylinositol transamidase (GPIT) subunit GPI8
MPKPIHSSVRKDVNLIVRLSYSERQSLKSFAAEKKMTVSDLVRSLIKQELDRTK